MNLTVEMLINAGFRPLLPDKSCKRLNHQVVVFVHETVFNMPEQQQAGQPIIEWGRWAPHVRDGNHFVDGRWGAQRFKIESINHLHLFMRQWSYTYPDSVPALTHIDRLALHYLYTSDL